MEKIYYINNNYQRGSNVAYNFPFIGSQNQVISNPYMNLGLPSGNNDLCRFLQMSKTSLHQRENNLLDPSSTSILCLTEPSACYEPNLKISPSNNAKLQTFEDSSVLVRATENNHITTSVLKKPCTFSDGQDRSAINCNPAAKASGKTSDEKNDISRSSISVNEMIEIDNEIIALKGSIDSLYSKLNEIQQKRQTTIQNLQVNEESKLVDIININHHEKKYLNITHEAEESAERMGNNETFTTYQLAANNNDQNEEQQANKESPENSAQEITWEDNGHFKKTELITSPKIENSFETYEGKISNEMKIDDDIIVVDFPHEMTDEKIRNNDRNSISNQYCKLDSVSPVEMNKNFDRSKYELKSSGMTDQTCKLKTNDAVFAMKQIQKFRNATYHSQHIKKIENVDSSKMQHKKAAYSSKHFLPQVIHPAKLANSIIGFQEPRSAFQPPVQFSPMLYFPNILTPTENHHQYFAKPCNTFMQSVPTQFSTAPATIQPFQQHPTLLLNNQFPTIDNTINDATNRLNKNLLPHNSYTTDHKLLFKNGLLSSQTRKRSLNSKSRNANKAQTYTATNATANVPNAINFVHVAKEQNINWIKNPFNPFQFSACQQMLNMQDQSIQIPNMERFLNNGELQQIANI